MYVVGYEANDNGSGIALYWKNGIRVILRTSLDCNYYAYAIAVSGSNVYVGGKGYDKEGAILYWKNGAPIRNKGTDTNPISVVNAAAISGSDVYLAGSFGSLQRRPVYWKNDSLIYFPGEPAMGSSDEVSSIAVSGPDVYALGFSGIAYWKNNTPVIVDNTPGSAQAIAVLGTDVYIAANKIVNGKGRAMYWKNNVPVYLSDSNHQTESRAIAVVKQ